MKRTARGIFASLALLPSLALLQASPAAAQTVQLPDMEMVARALGVECAHCHVRRRNGEPEVAAPTGKPKLEIAKEMIAMTRDLNATIQAASGKSATEATRVECVTCHRGVAIPKQLSEIILRTVVDSGGATATNQYRELRERYYGRASYDFSEAELLRVAQRLLDRRPDDAIALLELNLEYNPSSSASYAAIAYAFTRKRDPVSAIMNLEKALELNPNDGFARGRLEQLKDDLRRR